VEPARPLRGDVTAEGWQALSLVLRVPWKVERPGRLTHPAAGAFACSQVTPAASLALLHRSMVRYALSVPMVRCSPDASLGLAIGPETGLLGEAWSGLRPRGMGMSPGAVARSDVDAVPGHSGQGGGPGPDPASPCGRPGWEPCAQPGTGRGGRQSGGTRLCPAVSRPSPSGVASASLDPPGPGRVRRYRPPGAGEERPPADRQPGRPRCSGQTGGTLT